MVGSLLDRVNQNKSMTEVLNVVKDIFDLITYHDKWINDFFLHPLGFYYCRLYHNDEHQIRLHIWEPNYPVKQDLYIHDHFYDLCSWVLCGEIKDFLYVVQSTTDTSDYCMFTTSYSIDKNIRILARTNNFLLVKKKEERIIKKNEKYIIPKDTFHSNTVLFDESNLTVTFVFTFNHKENHSPNVVGSSKNELYYESNPIMISPEKVKELITKAEYNIWGRTNTEIK
ncbi:hypothetical protein GCM10023189_06960 [Nibrella saemangeumensis]|uniref:Cysteine dioxygenase n=1 Tax=Nibrella saemangeumensis TaxID=1084526 RepID=A0ABP8MH28_9BACT